MNVCHAIPTYKINLVYNNQTDHDKYSEVKKIQE